MIRADRRKFHYIYKITRIDTGKYYIGMHSTDDLEDGYFGSGKLITASVKKHGKEKHIKEILEYCDSRESLKVREKELIGEFYRLDEHCLNLQPGGGGGFKDDDHRKAFMQGALDGYARKWEDPDFRKTASDKRSKTALATYQGGRRLAGWAGDTKCRSLGVDKAKMPEAIEKRKNTYKNQKHQQGENNSQFGMMWIFSIVLCENRRIRKTDPIPDGWCKGRRLKFTG